MLDKRDSAALAGALPGWTQPDPKMLKLLGVEAGWAHQSSLRVLRKHRRRRDSLLCATCWISRRP